MKETYTPKPIDTSNIVLPQELQDLMEKLSLHQIIDSVVSKQGRNKNAT